MAKKEDQIQIPEAVFNRANFAAREASLGSPFTQREKKEIGIPQFPYGGLSSTSLDRDSRYSDLTNDINVQYQRDAETRMANRYTFPTVDIARQNISFGNPFGGRASSQSYVDPYRSLSISQSNSFLRDVTNSSQPNVGQAGFTRSVLEGPNSKAVEQVVSPYGFASTSLTPQQMEQRALARSEAERTGTMPRTPEQQQALLAQMREAGAGIKERIAATNAREAKENLGKYYAFRQGIAEAEAQRALTPSFGTTVSRGETMRGAQAMVEASRFGEAARTGRLTQALEPVKTRFGEFALGSMGQYSPIRPRPSGGPQPASSFGTMQSSFGMPSAIGSIASGFLPSFSLGGGEQKDEYLRRNNPQDYFTGAFGSEGRRMMYRPNPFDQTRTL